MPVYPMPPLPSDDKRWKIVNGTMRRHGYTRNALIETLHTVQSSFGYLDDNCDPLCRQVAARAAEPGLRRGHLLPPLQPEAAGQTYLHHLHRHGLLYQRRGQARAAAEKQLGIKAGKSTPDGNISLMTARCVGACGRAPVMLADEDLVGLVEPARMLEQLERWAAHD